jgi:hypothetical protein
MVRPEVRHDQGMPNVGKQTLLWDDLRHHGG